MRRGLVAVTLLLTCGCGAVSGGEVSLPTPPNAALAAWRDFPAAASPRPIVWTSSPVPRAYTDNSSKIAGICNKLVLGAGVEQPEPVPARATITWPSGASASYSAISAMAAFTDMAVPPAGMDPAQCAGVAPNTVTRIQLGTAGFGTDRGTAQMTAWLFDVAGVDGGFAYPALDPSAFWRGGMYGGVAGNGYATVSADGTTLQYDFTGASAGGPCITDYTGLAAESSAAVAVAIGWSTHGNCGGISDAVGHPRSVTIRLAAPLGGRVLLDEKGNVVVACREGGGC